MKNVLIQYSIKANLFYCCFLLFYDLKETTNLIYFDFGKKDVNQLKYPLNLKQNF
jgi:hypothetical protein